VTIDWLPFLIAVLLLWLPRQVLRLGGKVLRFGGRRRKIRDTNPAHVREHGDPAVSLREEIAKPRNTIDLLRATLGSVVILGTFEGIEPALRAGPGADAAELQRVFFFQIAVLLAGVLIQTFRYEGRLTLFAPIFYLSGLTFGMCGFYPALFALVLVWTINLGLPNAAAFLSVYALLVGTFGLMFDGLANPLPLIATGLLILPVFFSLLLRRRLAQFSKRLKVPGSAA